MIKNRSRQIAWGLTTIVVLSIFMGLILWVGELSERPDLYQLSEVLGLRALAPLVFALVAALIISQQPANRVGWLLMLFALAATNPISAYSGLLLQRPPALTLRIWLVIWINSWSWIPIFFPIFLIALHFPTGKPPSPRWNWVNWLALGMWVLFMILAAINDTFYPPDESWSFPNPIGFASEEHFWPVFMPFWGLGLLTVVFASIGSLFVRYRRAKHQERGQIKWLLYGGGFFALNYTIAFFQADQSSTPSWILSFLFVFSILAIPLSIGIAILRHQLYDIDIIIRRTVVYGMLTAALGLIYFGTVVVLQTAVGRAADEQSPLITVLSTLLIAALFSPLRRRIQTFIDRRFYRRKYDATQILAQFAATARDEVELEQLTDSIQLAVEQTLQPEVIFVWLPKTKVEKR